MMGSVLNLRGMTMSKIFQLDDIEIYVLIIARTRTLFSVSLFLKNTCLIGKKSLDTLQFRHVQALSFSGGIAVQCLGHSPVRRDVL